MTDYFAQVSIEDTSQTTTEQLFIDELFRPLTPAEDMGYTVMAFVWWVTIAFNLVKKAGHDGISFWIWFLLLAFPPTMLFVSLLFVFTPSPVAKDLKRYQEKFGPLK